MTTPQHQSAAAAASHTAAASCAHRRPSMPQTKRTCQQPTFVHQDELWLTQTQRHANRSPPPVARGLLNNNADSPTDDGNNDGRRKVYGFLFYFFSPCANPARVARRDHPRRYPTIFISSALYYLIQWFPVNAAKSEPSPVSALALSDCCPS